MPPGIEDFISGHPAYKPRVVEGRHAQHTELVRHNGKQRERMKTSWESILSDFNGDHISCKRSVPTAVSRSAQTSAG